MSKPELSMAPVEACTRTSRVREPLTAEAAGELAALCKALSDPIRLRLLSAIASHVGGQACVCDLSEGIDLTQPTISHHLRVLRDAGLLTSERRASWVYYRVVPEALTRVSQALMRESDAVVGVSA